MFAIYKREASSENYGPRVYFYHILKILKILCCTFTLLYFYFIYFTFILVRSIYLSPYNLILQLTAKGLTTPCSRWVQGFVILCAGVANELLHDSPIGLITLVSLMMEIHISTIPHYPPLFGENPTRLTSSNRP